MNLEHDIKMWKEAALRSVVELMTPLVGAEKAAEVLDEDGSVEGASNLALWARWLGEPGVEELLGTQISILETCRERGI